METLVSILVASVGGLAFLLFNKSKESVKLKADKDLTDRKSESKIVDNQLEALQNEIGKLEEEMNKPVDGNFWDSYSKKDK